jgi:hypothetical protein
MLYPVTSLGTGIRVKWVDCYQDSTMTACITDGEGRITFVCIDGRAGSPTRHRLFQQARHPRQEGAVLLELGRVEEGNVVPLISRWLDSASPKQLGLTELGWEWAREALLHLGEPIVRGAPDHPT